MPKGRQKDCRSKRGELSQGKTVFQTQQGCGTYEHTEIVIAYPRPEVFDQTKILALRREVDTNSIPNQEVIVICN